MFKNHLRKQSNSCTKSIQSANIFFILSKMFFQTIFKLEETLKLKGNGKEKLKGE